jgi:virginiamycin A acetyltransferase
MNLIADILYRLYPAKTRILRALFLRMVCRLEGGDIYSQTLRRIFRDYYRVDVGLYTHSECFVPGAFDRHTTVGRYCSIAQGVRTMNRNHPLEFKSTHAFFFNPELGLIREDPINYLPLEIGNDVWIGAKAVILPNVRKIGDGAVIGASAVVNKDVPPYAVVVGNPARVVRFRFPPEVISRLLASRWWEKPIEELDLNEFTRPYLGAATPPPDAG